MGVKSTHKQRHTAIQWSTTHNIAPSSLIEQGPLLQSSVLDLLAAPTVFLQQALVYEQQLVPGVLREALQDVIDQQSIFAARLAVSKDGQLSLALPQSTAGIAVIEGHLPGLTLQNVSSHNRPDLDTQPHQELELPNVLFGHLPGSLMPAYKDNPDLALVCVALVTLQGGGCMLGFRMSHLLGDWGSLQLLMQATAAAYGRRTLQQQQQQQQQGQQQACNDKTSSTAIGHCSNTADNTTDNPDSASCSASNDAASRLVLAAPLLNHLVFQSREQLSAEFQPVRFKHLTPEDEANIQKLAALVPNDNNTEQAADDRTQDADSSSTTSSTPERLTYHIPPARLKQLKADAAAAAEHSIDLQDNRWCTSHNVILARLLQAFVNLPGRENLHHDISVAVDMRSKLPSKSLRQLSVQQQQQLRYCVGNFFATAIYEGCCGADLLNEWQLAQKLYDAVQTVRDIWLPDLAWASEVMQLSHDDPVADSRQHTSESCLQQKPEAVQQQQQPAKQAVTWRRLHAMGPYSLLPKQLGLGLLPSLSTTQWPLDFARHTSMAGQLPASTVPGFSQPQPYPLVLMQQATAAAGGGMMVHVFLDKAEASVLQQILEAQGGI